MSAMYRIICSKLLVLIRLAIVVSLSGYSLSNATAAMHGSGSSDARQTISQAMEHHDAEVASHDHHGDVSADDEDDGVNLAKQECCNDFCVSFAIIATSDALGGPFASSIHEFIDDRRFFGEIPDLHRPPNI